MMKRLTKQIRTLGIICGLLVLIALMSACGTDGGNNPGNNPLGGGNQNPTPTTTTNQTPTNNQQTTPTNNNPATLPSVADKTLKLAGASNFRIIYAANVTAPTVSSNSNGKTVSIVLQGSTYVISSPNDITNSQLEVKVPKNINLDLSISTGTIQVEGVVGQMALVISGNGNIFVKDSTLAGNSKLVTVNGSLQFASQLAAQSKVAITGADSSITGTLLSTSKLHLVTNAQQSGSLTGNFPGLPTNQPRTYNGYLNNSQGDANAAELTLTVKNGSIVLNKAS
jgi:hypothetical protein